jgi:hypothetical protein
MRKLPAIAGAAQRIALAASVALTTPLALSAPFFFSTGNPDGKIATASRPENGAKFEIESADDFALTQFTSLTSATFTALLTGGATTANIGEVRVEIYRVFPDDSNVGRTSGSPTFSTPQVPTRVNSPSDVELADRDTAAGNLTLSTTSLGTFSALNSVAPGGIHPLPGIFTGGNGSVTGSEVEFDVTFTTPFVLAPGHYFFVPQVDVSGSGNFLWLSAPRPIVAPGTPFPAGFTDLQSWTRDEFLDPDWLRVGTDITGQGPFNAAFSLSGAVPEPGTELLLGASALVLWWQRRRRT